MMRQSRSALRLLLRMQTARQKREADSEARDRDAWTEHCAINLMTEALSPPAAEPVAPASSPRETGLEKGTVPASHHAAKPATPVSPQRAALISVLKRLEDPDDELIQSLITFVTQHLTPLDQQSTA